VNYQLLSLIEDPPKGFRHLTNLTRKDVCRYPFAILALDRVSAEIALAPFGGELAGIIVTFDDTESWTQCAPLLFHITTPSASRDRLETQIKFNLMLLENCQQSEGRIKLLTQDSNRSREDNQRNREESAKTKEYLMKELAEHKQAEVLILDAINYIKTILSTSPIGIGTYKATGEALTANEAMARIIGAPTDTLVQQNFRTLNSWKSSGVLSNADEALKTGVNQRGDYHMLTTFGKEVDIDCLLVPFMFSGEKHLMFIIIDITDRKRAEGKLAYTNALTNAAFESTANGILVVDKTGKISRFNQKFIDIWKVPKELHIVDDDTLMLKHATSQLANPDEFYSKVINLYDHPEASSQDLVILADGRYLERYSQPVRIDQEIVGRFWSFHDCTERKIAEDKIRLMAQVFEHSGEAIVITDQTNSILAVNSSFSRHTGYSQAEVIGKNPNILKSGKENKEFYANMWEQLTKNDYWQGEIGDKRKDGSCYPKWLAISVVRDDEGTITNYIGCFTDITERKQAELEIEHLAHHDHLTKLFNRFSLLERLSQVLELAKRSGSSLALLFIDVDRFKNINDSLGHHVGDLLLSQIAVRLLESVRSADIVARFGGDEFVVVLPQIQSGIAVVPFVAKIQHVLSQPYILEGNKLYITPSIGISVFPHDGETTDDLLKNADLAMYHAKANGRNNYQYFMPEMNARAHERLLLERGLRAAVERNEFLLHYQPQFNIATGQLVGVEALVRWQHPKNGIIPPDVFIPIAEETGIILAIGEIVLKTACRQLKSWIMAGFAPIRIAVNLSAVQLKQERLPELVAATIKECGIAAHLLELEITESVAMKNPEETIIHLRAFREMGVELAIDDFGTGYSSLSYLKLFPVNRLKIDRSFVQDLEISADDSAIAAATIALAHTLGKEVIAEGIETQAQLDFLRKQKCDIGQGYYYSRPVPADEISKYFSILPICNARQK